MSDLCIVKIKQITINPKTTTTMKKSFNIIKETAVRFNEDNTPEFGSATFYASFDAWRKAHEAYDIYDEHKDRHEESRAIPDEWIAKCLEQESCTIVALKYKKASAVTLMFGNCAEYVHLSTVSVYE